MMHYFHCVLTISLGLSLRLPSLAERPAGSLDSAALTITVRVYDYAGVPGFIADRGREEATRIFHLAGVSVEWVLCTIPGQVAPKDPQCEKEPLATDIQLNILPRKMARALMRHHSELGAAVTLLHGFGRRASVFYHRVDELAEIGGASRALLLGHIMAHEIGHLLLGVSSHSATGLMHVPWGRDQRERASLGTLLFTDKEAEQIRSQVEARFRAAQSSGEGEPARH